MCIAPDVAQDLLVSRRRLGYRCEMIQIERIFGRGMRPPPIGNPPCCFLVMPRNVHVCWLPRTSVSCWLACFPMQFEPTNFLEILIGSQLSMMLRKVRSVVPSVRGSSPALNSWINLSVYNNKRTREIRKSGVERRG